MKANDKASDKVSDKASDKAKLTPLMQQYWDIKSLHQDKILFFRMGDFFELFYDDAVKAAPLLGITLTQRNKKSEDQTPMCGMPHHSVAGSINKLLSLGYKVALCDQIEDPKFAKGIVKRAITRILTPGMVYDPETLEATKANYICGIDHDSVSFVDTSTGESFYFLSNVLNEKINLIEVMPVVEIVVNSDFNQAMLQDLNILLTEHVFESPEALSQSEIPFSAKLLLSYIESLAQAKVSERIRPFERRHFSHRLKISQNTQRHLELFSTYKGQEHGSLFATINKTKTSAGARLLRQNLLFPLRDLSEISERLDYVTILREHLFELKKMREHLAQMGDIERRLSKIALPQANGRDLWALSDSIQAGLLTLDTVQRLFVTSALLQTAVSECESLALEIKKTIIEEAPLSVRQGYLIQKGYSQELDELIELSTNAQTLLQEMESRERSRTGISSLKIRYNNVFGYYIEVTNTHKDKIPPDYQRKQTLANAERYCTDELIELEKKILSAQTKRNDLEYSIYENLKNKIIQKSSHLLLLAQRCSELDFYAAMAWLSLENSYCRPQFNPRADNRKIHLVDSRHPVVEQFVKAAGAQRFVANSLEMGGQTEPQCFLITGPNMAGKSTLMRQVALIALLAQMGSYVPATEATLPIYDAIYTRIGASDQLTEGLSTFMVEMSETAELLEKATENSLLILDEIGRGTATFDGLCLAQAILEYLLQNLKAHAFFATHYHELTDLEKVFSRQLKNVHMQIHDNKGQIQFLYILSPGPAGQSYGIQVAELAGLPKAITERAKELLVKLETVETQAMVQKLNSSPSVDSPRVSTKETVKLNKKENPETKVQTSFFDS